MSVRVLELDHFHLIVPEDEIEWSVSPSVHAKIPESIFYKRNEDIIDALTSGNLWATRGAYCSLDFFITAGQLLNSGQKLRLCESLGDLIRDAHVSMHLTVSRAIR
jgi:hypothetical protein